MRFVDRIVSFSWVVLRKWIFLISLSFMPFLVGEEGEASSVDYTPEAFEGKSYNYWGEFVNMLITLFIILGLVIVSVWLLKRIMRSRIQHLNKSTGIKILERRALNTKASLYLVNILGKGVVIAESPSGIQLITEFSKETDIDALFEQVLEEQSPRVSFRESLTKKMRKLTKHARRAHNR